jgi:signal transduction histidine kinase
LGSVVTSIREGSTLGEQIVFNPIGYPLFIFLLSSVFFAGLFVLLYKVRARGAAELYNDLDVYQVSFVIYANFVAGVLGIGFNLILPLYGIFSLFYLNPVFVTAALTLIGVYNISRHNLFNARVFLAEFFTGAILALTATRIILADTNEQRVADGVLFLVLVGVGTLLVQGVLREVRHLELIEKQEKDLRIVNSQQVTLLHFISHEIKGYLTKGQNAFAGIIEGDYGSASSGVLNLSQAALREMRKGVETVMAILEASNLKKGTVSYDKRRFDMKATLQKVIDDLRDAAVQKQLHLDVAIAPTGTFEIYGDEAKIAKHVLRNLLDNAVRYTLAGQIRVGLSGNETNVTFTVQDTGVGISSEDMQKLFTEGGHGKDSLKVNVDSTGYGLYIAKQIVEAHGGRIWAESEGVGKGSRFTVEFPIASPSA